MVHAQRPHLALVSLWCCGLPFVLSHIRNLHIVHGQTSSGILTFRLKTESKHFCYN